MRKIIISSTLISMYKVSRLTLTLPKSFHLLTGATRCLCPSVQAANVLRLSQQGLHSGVRTDVWECNQGGTFQKEARPLRGF